MCKVQETHKVVARLKKPLFRKAYLVYDVVENYQYWDDPSYGNGGGDYRAATRVLGTFTDKGEASVIVKGLLGA